MSVLLLSLAKAILESSERKGATPEFQGWASVDRRPYQTDRNYAAAFQQSQLTVSGNPQTAHLYYWAPFILIGAR